MARLTDGMKNVAGMAAFKAHATFGFWKGSLVVGDSHRYAATPHPFSGDEVDGLMLREQWIAREGLMERLCESCRLAVFTGRQR